MIYSKILSTDGLQFAFAGIMKALYLFNPFGIVYAFSYYIIGARVSYYYGFYLGLVKSEFGCVWLYSVAVSPVLLLRFVQC